MFLNEGVYGFPQLAVLLLSTLLHGLGRDSENHVLCCGKGFPVHGKEELMGLILKESAVLPLCSVCFSPSLLLSFSD